MKFLRKRIKLIAALLGVNFLSSLFAPNVAYALTAGPTNPDYTSFEPVDTTDMVNLLSGDLAYNIPLLEVPGPAGGYPLSLSYHAGIMPNEDASWVGLGWTLNPGAINRSVNGYPDDHKNVETTDRFFWEGGERKQVDVGVSLGIAGLSGVSAGISIGTDTYQGFGIGGFVSTGVGLLELGGSENGNIGVNATFGVDPWGNSYQSFGVSLGTEIEGLNFSSGVSTNFQSVGFSAGLSADYGKTKNGASRGSGSLVGASISSGTGIASVSAVGASGIVNNKSGNISTSSTGFTLPLPFVHLGYKKTKYWIDETENIETNGALFYPNYEVDKDWLNTHTYDTYYAVDPDEFTRSGFPELNGAKSVGGSFVNYDHYSISGQGISGNIKPYKFQQHLLRQNVTTGDEVIQYVTGYDTDQSFTWRFVNDFSNRVEYDPTNFSNPYGQIDKTDFNFSSLSVVGESGVSSLINGLNGSKSIVTYTNKDITDAVAERDNGQGWSLDVIDNNATGFERNHLPWDQIGAYVVTNESGVSYHYSLPACSYDEYQYSENIERGNGHTFNELKRPEEYAYAWHLTAITGPDFVDRGVLGELDEEDWGYWVDFEYGKWTDQYFWRNPGEDMELDVDNNFQNYSEGTKELYYLDAIKTKSHTALFVKDIREDALSSLPLVKNWTRKGSSDAGYLLSDEVRQGGYGEQAHSCFCNIDVSSSFHDWGSMNYTARSTKSLRLDKIVLIDNEDLTSFNKSHGSAYHQTTSGVWNIHENSDMSPTIFDDCDFTPLNINHHLFGNVYDIYDYQAASIDQESIRVIDFNNDHYDLVPGTPNSSSGKLTLKGLNFKGKGGVQLTPPMKFAYDIESTANVDNATILNNKYLFVSNFNASEGDMLKVTNSTGGIGYFVTSSTTVDSFGIRFGTLKPVHDLSINTFSGSITYSQTKNPGYGKNYFDNWGLYKSDFDTDLCEVNEALGRLGTDLSAKSLDVWSLREVTTSLGSKIEIAYESDDYQTATNGGSLIHIDQITSLGSSDFQIDLESINAGTFEIADYYKVGEKIAISAVYEFNKYGIPSSLGGDPPLPNYDIKNWSDDTNYAPVPLIKDSDALVVIDDGDLVYPVNATATIESINGNSSIVVNSSDLWEKLYNPITLKGRSYLYNISNPTAVGTNKIRDYEITLNIQPQHFYGGLVTSSNTQTGGGIRVKHVDVVSDSQTKRLSYEYSNGVSSYEPFIILPAVLSSTASGSGDDADKRKLIEENSYFLYSDIIKNAREIPSPGVLYGSVTVQGYVGGERIPNYETYEFETFKAGMIDYHEDNDVDEDVAANNWSYDSKQFDRQRTRRIYKRDFSSRVGSLKRMSVYDLNDEKLTETINHYLHDELSYPSNPTDQDYFDVNQTTYVNLVQSDFNDQGVLEETFADARLIKNNGQYEMLGVISKNERYPSIQTGTTTINYRTGITTTTRNLGYDFYSGQLTHSYSDDGYGNKYVTKNTPAYRYYPQMTNKNMLVQEGSSYSYKMNNSFDPVSFTYTDKDDIQVDATGLMGASFQKWSENIPYMDANTRHENTPGTQIAPDIYRKSSSHTYIGRSSDVMNANGTLLASGIDEILPGEPLITDEASGWQTNSTITLYDVNSHALEASDVNGNYAATKFDFKNERVIATVANAEYDEFVYRNYESEVVSAFSHTGQSSLDITSNNIRSFALTLPTDRNIMSVWVHESNANNFEMSISYAGTTLSSVSIDPNKKSGEWFLVEMQTELSGLVSLNYRNLGVGTIYVDDFRMHPVDATMTGYVYNEWGELSDVLDANNLFTHYDYDEMGRLKSITRETLNHGPVKVSENIIHYAGN